VGLVKKGGEIMEDFNIMCEKCEERTAFYYIERKGYNVAACPECYQDFIETEIDLTEYQLADR
jgi:hypothetical protein